VAQALTHQRASLALFRRVAAADSTQTGRVRAVGISLLKLGDLLGHPSFTNTGDTSAAMGAYNEAVQQLESAAAHGDTTVFLRRHRAIIRERLGRLMQERRDFPSAARWLNESLIHRDSLMQQLPRSVQARRDVAITLYLLCGLHVSEGFPDRALEPCQRSLTIRQALLNEDPANPVLIRGMGIMHRQLGLVQAKRRDSATALAEYNAAIGFYDRFFNGRAGPINDRRDYAQAIYNYLLNVLRLKAAVGTLSEDDLIYVNQWLEK
jgi:tetratricopeptide (TPR) repeat protein